MQIVERVLGGEQDAAADLVAGTFVVRASTAPPSA